MLGILIDVTRCTGCERCVSACVKSNDSEPLRAAADRSAARDGLSADRLCSVVPVAEGRFAKKSCLHCLEPSCVSACLVGALEKTADGPVIYDPAMCIGCRYCMLACPFHIPRYEWDEVTPAVVKCDMCQDRLAEGKQPACVEACPEEALLFGDRDQLIETARARIAEHPDAYIDHVWGETEFGGTSVMYISDVDLGALEWPAPDASGIPQITEPMIAATP